MSRVSAVIALLCAMACKSGDMATSDAGCEPLTESPCSPGQFHYDDERCSGPVPGGGEPSCETVGDGLCHATCEDDGDCSNPCRPHCRTIGLYRGGDFSCNGTVSVCSAEATDECVLGS